MRELKQIAIVGTGPGHPDCITTRALEYLKNADVILYDCLIDEITLSVVPENTLCERVEKKYRKHNNVHIFDQAILQKMIDYLEQGKKVVRIKPGDSMNFNSGGMEADFLISKGYEIEIVPGIPTHLGAACYFNFNLTEIDQSNGLISFMADELDKNKDLVPHIAYLMKYGGVPVCFYGMQAATFPVIKDLLQAGNICDHMPVAICGDVSLESSKLIKTNLGECIELVQLLEQEEKMPAHYIVIMGKYLFESYVDFKSETLKKSLTCAD